MLLKNIVPNLQSVKNLIINESSIIHLIPDVDTEINEDTINKLSIDLSYSYNDYILVLRTKYKIKNTSRSLFSNNYISNKDSNSKFKFISNLTGKLPSNKFLFVDHSLLVKSLFSLNINLASEELIENLLIKKHELSDDFGKEIHHLFLFVSNTSNFLQDEIENDIFKLLNYLASKNAKHYKDIGLFELVDYPMFLSFNSELYNVVSKKQDDEVIIKKVTLNKIADLVEDKRSEIILKVSVLDNTKEDKSVIKKEIEIKKQKEEPDYFETKNTKTKIDKITEYIHITKNPFVKTNTKHLLTSDSVNTDTIPLAIKFDTDKDSDIKSLLRRKTKLLDKKEEHNFYQDLIIPKMPNKLIQPRDIIDLNIVTSPSRQVYEYNELLDKNIDLVLKTLENRKENPIKILKTEKKVYDDNFNRYVEYKITMQNSLNTGTKEPYDVFVRIPMLVNDKYLKLNGKSYIPISQHYLNPVTKDKIDEVRFISHYSILRLILSNLDKDKFEIDKIIKYIKTKYTNIILKEELNSDDTYREVRFKDTDETIINLDDDVDVFMTDNKNKYSQIENDSVIIESIEKGDSSENILKGKTRNEVIIDRLQDIILYLNPSDKEYNKDKNSYIQIYVVGVKIPLILLLWREYGLLEALNIYGVHYKIVDADSNENNKDEIPDYIIECKGKNILLFNDNSRRNFFYTNGLRHISKNYSKNFESSVLITDEFIKEFISYKYGSRKNNNLDLFLYNGIDPTTKEILDFLQYPTKVLDLINQVMIPMLFNDKPDHPNDLSTMRSRMSEVITHVMYSELYMAHNSYVEQLKYGNKDAKLFLNPNYIIDNLLGKHKNSSGSSLIEYVEPFSPIDEVIKSTKVVKTGIGGVPSKRAFRKEQRDIHESHIGNIAAHSTSEYSDVGILQFHTLGANIINKYGSYGPKLKSLSKYNYDSLGADEVLVPFVNQMDSGRLIIARTHMGQKIPIIEGEKAIVETGGEYILTNLVSSRFIYRSKEKGEVVEVVPNSHIKVKYTNGEVDLFDLSPRYSYTKRASIIHITFNNLKIGDKFEKNQPIAWNKGFDGNTLAIGRNCKMAVVNYIGHSFEDGYVITESLANKFKSENIKKIVIVVPPDTRVLFLNNNKGRELSANSLLIEFEYKEVLEEYEKMLENTSYTENNLDVDEFIELDTSNKLIKSSRNTIKKFSPAGILVDYRIRLSTKKGIDKLLVDEWKKQNEEIKNREEQLRKYRNNGLEFSDNVDTSLFELDTNAKYIGCQIEFYIKNEEPRKLGDKISNRFGAKGVITHIIPPDQTPKAEEFGEIDMFYSISSLFGRKNSSIIKELSIGKIIYLFPEIIKKDIESNKSLESIKEKILKVYDYLDFTPDKDLYKSVSNSLESITLSNLLKYEYNYIIPPFVNVNFVNIQKCADYLGIKLKERIFYPRLNMWSKEEYPVGISFMSAMEQSSDDYAATRGIAGYVTSTGQPVKGKSRQGGQSMGNYDIFNLLTYGDVNHIFKEMFTARSDNRKSKIDMLSQLRTTGKIETVNVEKTGQTQNLLKMYFIAMGLMLKE